MSERSNAGSPAGTLGSEAVRESSLVPPWLAALAELGWRVLVITVLLVVLGLAAAVVWTVVAAIILMLVWEPPASPDEALTVLPFESMAGSGGRPSTPRE